MILTFVDASKDACGAVSYFRTDRNPRLELLAAVLELRLTTSIAAKKIPLTCVLEELEPKN